MLRRLGSFDSPDPEGSEELALLTRFSERGELAETFLLTADQPLDLALVAPLDLYGSVWVRPLGTLASAVIVLLDADADAGTLKIEASSLASGLFGVSATRFDSLLPPSPDAAVIAATLTRLGAARPALPAYGLARLVDILAQLRAKHANSPILIQALRRPLAAVSVTSRDARTGAGPTRVSLSHDERALSESVGWRPIDQSPLDNARRAQLSQLAASCEAAARRPVRLVLEEGNPDRVLAAIPLKKSGLIAFELAVDLVHRGAATKLDALRLIEPSDVAQAVPLELDIEPRALITTGIAAGTGIATGRVALSPARALEMTAQGSDVILFAHELEPEDAAAVKSAAGVVTVRGGITGEAAVMARALGKPCVASGSALSLSREGVVVAGGGLLEEGALITVDGARGHIVRDHVARKLPVLTPAVAEVLSWIDRSAVYACATSPSEVRTALALGAAGPALTVDDRATLQRALAGTGATEALVRSTALPAAELEALCASVQELTGVLLRPLAFPTPPKGCVAHDGVLVCARPEDVLLAALGEMRD